jgi:hypothetical protein
LCLARRIDQIDRLADSASAKRSCSDARNPLQIEMETQCVVDLVQQGRPKLPQGRPQPFDSNGTDLFCLSLGRHSETNAIVAREDAFAALQVTGTRSTSWDLATNSDWRRISEA